MLLSCSLGLQPCCMLFLALFFFNGFLLDADASLDLAALVDAIFLFLVPVLDFAQHGLQVDMRDVEVLSELLPVERFSSTWWPSDEDLHRLETAFLTEFFFHQLDVGGEAILAVPIEVRPGISTFFAFGSTSHKKRARFNLEIEHQRNAPI